MALNDQGAVSEQYRTADKLGIRISLHRRYSTNRQGFGSWIVSHYRIENGMSVLELGCGTGDMWAGQDELIGRCGRLILSDLSEGMLAQAKKTLENQKGVAYRTVDIQSIPYADASFDIVIANMMLYHVPDRRKALAEVRRVLRNNGTFYCATYGENGMMEYLCGLFEQYGVKNHPNHQFTLQNGEAQLSPFFSDIRRYDYHDALEVTDPEDMADYIGSLTGMSELRQLPRETLLSVLRAHMTDGALRVPKEYGMFVARP